MTQATALAVRPQLTPDVWRMILEVAPVVKSSRLFGMASDEQAAAIMLKGYELGFGLTASFEFVHVIDGKPGLSPRGMLAVIQASGLAESIEIVETQDAQGAPAACSVTLRRRNGPSYTAVFSMEHARRAGLTKEGSGWVKYPDRMLLWRALGFAADVVFPDLLNGLKRADELGADLTPNGDVVEAVWRETPAVPAVRPAPDPVVRLQRLLEQYGAEAIIHANGGRIPGTNAELDTAEAALVEASHD